MRKKLPKFIVATVGITILVLLFTTGSCTFSSGNTPKVSENEIALSVFEVDTGTVELQNNFLGTVEGKFNVEIRPQVSGELLEAYVDEGDYVEKGQKLFKIDPLSYQEDLNRAVANQNVERANLNNAQTEVDRLRPLVENEVMAPVRLEKEKSNYQVAEANLKQASAEVANARIKLGYTTIKAPVSGYIGRIEKRIGNLVNPGDKEAITVLTDVQEVYVYFSINESQFFDILKNQSKQKDSVSKEKPQEVSLILPDGSVYPEKGFIDATSGQVNKNTGTVVMRANFPNEDNILRSGNTGSLVMHNVEHGKILIPQKATFELQTETFVQKLTDDNRVIRQIIQIESSAPDNQYIVASGLKKGDRILVEGLDKVADSTKIKPLPYHREQVITPN